MALEGLDKISPSALEDGSGVGGVVVLGQVLIRPISRLGDHKVQGCSDLLRFVRGKVRLFLCPVVELIEPPSSIVTLLSLECLGFTDDILGTTGLQSRGDCGKACH